MFRTLLAVVFFVGAALAAPSTTSAEFESLERRFDTLQQSNDRLSEQLSKANQGTNSKLDEQLLLLKQLSTTLNDVAEKSGLIYDRLTEQAPIESCKQAPSSGVYTLNNDNLPDSSKQVYCEMGTLGGGWTVIQQRLDGSVDFNRSWAEYRNGFGTVGDSSEFWLGLEAVHVLTNQLEPMELLIELKNEKGKYGYARYGSFQIDAEAELYRMSWVLLYQGSIGNSLSVNWRERFSTYDRDNDRVEGVNCAQKFGGGWWFYRCVSNNLNGPFTKDATTNQGIFWKEYTTAGTYSRMMIRPKK